jgi:hypothetical protein
VSGTLLLRHNRNISTTHWYIIAPPFSERPSVDGLDKDVEYELRLKELEFQERLRTDEIELRRSELKEKKKSTKALKEHDFKTQNKLRSLKRKMDYLEIQRQNERLRNQR